MENVVNEDTRYCTRSEVSRAEPFLTNFYWGGGKWRKGIQYQVSVEQHPFPNTFVTLSSASTLLFFCKNSLRGMLSSSLISPIQVTKKWITVYKMFDYNGFEKKTSTYSN